MHIGAKALFPWLAAGLLLLPSSAALAADSESDSDLDDTVNVQCTSTLATGNYDSVVVPAGASCTVPSGVQIFRNLTVRAGGTLTLQGGTIGNDLRATDPAALNLSGASIWHDLRVDGGHGAHPGPDDGAGPGERPGPGHADRPAPAPGPASSTSGPLTICALTVGNNVDVRGGSTVVVGDTSHGCGSGLTIGADLRVDRSTGPAYVGDNSVMHTLRVQNDASGGEVVRNRVGNDATCEQLSSYTVSGNTVDEQNHGC